MVGGCKYFLDSLIKHFSFSTAEAQRRGGTQRNNSAKSVLTSTSLSGRQNKNHNLRVEFRTSFMQQTELDTLRFPIGKFVKPESISSDQIKDCISRIESFPSRLKKEVLHLTEDQLDTPYRPEGWTIRQVVHHCADSHMNAIVRFKLTLSENGTTIKPYAENLFAEMADYNLPIDSALQILDGVHLRLGVLLSAMKTEDFVRYYVHPEYGTNYRLDQAAMLYAWHCDHHLAHITKLMERKGWK